MKEPLSILMDVDTGVDDALALLLAVHSPELRLIGVTTVSGNTSARQAAWNTRLILEELNSEDRIPVRIGEGQPTHEVPHIHGRNGLGNLFWQTHDVSNVITPPQTGGVDFLLEMVEKYPGQLCIVATGPLTNLALACQRAPEVFARVKELRIMGGAVYVPGNITPHAEFNVYCDPEAFDIVLHAGVPITLFPLDVTQKVRLYKSSLTPQLGLEPRKLKLINDFMSTYFEFHQQARRGTAGFDGCYVHDALPVASLLEPSLFTYVEESIAVDVSSTPERGRTRRAAPGDGGVKIKIATDVREHAFLELFWKRLATSTTA